MSEAVETQNKEPQTEKPNVEAVKTRGRGKQDEDDEYWPLSGKPYFHFIISKTHVKSSFQLYVPARLYQVFPSVDIPAVLNYCGKTWNLMYLGDRSRKRFNLSWKDFATDNDLKIGDACVFELAECCRTKLIFEVQILRGDFPAELLAKAKGQTSNAPITLD